MSDPETNEAQEITEEEAAAMRAKLAAHDARKRQEEMAAAAEMAAARAAHMAPLRTIVDGQDYQAIQTKLADLVVTYAEDAPVGVILKAVAAQMANLQTWAAK